MFNPGLFVGDTLVWGAFLFFLPGLLAMGLFGYLSFRVLRGRGIIAFFRALGYAMMTIMLSLLPIRLIVMKYSDSIFQLEIALATGVCLVFGTLLGMWRGPKGRYPFSKSAVCLILLVVFGPLAAMELSRKFF